MDLETAMAFHGGKRALGAMRAEALPRTSGAPGLRDSGTPDSRSAPTNAARCADEGTFFQPVNIFAPTYTFCDEVVSHGSVHAGAQKAAVVVNHGHSSLPWQRP